MKKIYTLLLFAVSFAANIGFGQTTSFGIYQSDSISGCTNSVQLSTLTGNNPESGGIITVDWGDGTNETLNYTAAAGANTYESFVHGYIVAGIYTATFSIYSTTATANVGTPQTVQMIANDPANCGIISLYTFYADQSAGYYFTNVPYDFEGADGIVTTIIPSQSYSNDYSGLNLANLPYTVTINQQWLLDNGLELVAYSQSQPAIVISSFDSDGVANSHNSWASITCSSTATNTPDFNFGYSYGAFYAALQSGNIHLYVCNNSCSGSGSNAQVSLTFDPVLTPVTTGLVNPVVTGNVLTFDVSNISGCDLVIIPFTLPGTTPSGIELEFSAEVTSATPETNTSNNNTEFTAMVWNSYDPNNKLVNQPKNLNPNAQEVLQYVINFQNEGNYPALDVVVTDPISENLDLSTFRLVGAKHGVAASVNESNRTVTFSFNNIYLQPKDTDEEGSMGYVVYSIKELPGLPVDSEIENTAYIYFDFNPAIVTNTTLNQNKVLSVTEMNQEMITMYPNPASTSIHFEGATVEGLQVLDLAGKVVLDVKQVIANSVEVSSLANGIYQVIVSTQKGISQQKMVIRK